MRDHSKLRAFELANELALAAYSATSRFPKAEEFGLKSQMRRAAVSIPSNIVEGCARRSHGDFLRFLDIALSSSRELEYQASLASDLGIMDKDSASQLSRKSRETGKVINGLIQSLQ